ncbi:MAG: 50S ribosomal protein L24 [Candidatus Bostrichicola ureolyticus]|nr:MAG: 50S ribosomal protein L24 [Candidatus Bostrichicola ureolyticus]
MLKIKVGDKVIILSGNYKNRKGIIMKILKKKNKVIVSGINLIKKHIKKDGILNIEAPIHISNISLIDHDSGNPIRIGCIGFKINNDKKIRIIKKTGKIYENIN